jgi:hypothetical protein
VSLISRRGSEDLPCRLVKEIPNLLSLFFRREERVRERGWRGEGQAKSSRASSCLYFRGPQ